MRSLEWSLLQCDGVCMKRGNLDTGTDMHREKMMRRHTGRIPCAGEGGEWSDACTSQRRQQYHRKLGERHGHTLPHSPREEATLPTLRLWTLACGIEAVHFFRFSHTVLGILIWQPLEMNTLYGACGPWRARGCTVVCGAGRRKSPSVLYPILLDAF